MKPRRQPLAPPPHPRPDTLLYNSYFSPLKNKKIKIKSTIVAGLGGFFGTVLRFLSEKLGGILCHAAFPLGTFIANMASCFLIGIFYGWVSKRTFMTKQLNVFLITGLCGSFSTFSSFSDVMVSLLQKGDYTTFILYLLSSIILGLVMVVAGIASVSKPKNASPQTV